MFSFLLRLHDFSGHVHSLIGRIQLNRIDGCYQCQLKKKKTGFCSSASINKCFLLPSSLLSTSCTHSLRRFPQMLQKENSKWRLTPHFTKPPPTIFFGFPDGALETQPASTSTLISLSIPPHRCWSWHRLLSDTRQHAIFLVVGSTHSPCHET